MAIQQTATGGSFNTYSFATTLNSGEVKQLGGAKAVINLQETRSDGRLTYSSTWANNQMLKLVVPVSDAVSVIFFGTHNQNHYYQADTNGATLAQVAQFGKNFALTNDPTQPTYYKYNSTNKETDFEYLRVSGDLGDGFLVDNTGYTYFYQNDTLSALDVTGATPNGTKAGPKGNTDIPGYSKNNEYRVWGDVIRADVPVTEQATLRAGFWAERASTKRYRFDYDFTLAPPGSAKLIADPREKTAPFNINYLQHSGWHSYQPFATLEVRPFDNLSITPGIKYVSFERFTNAFVQQGSRVAAVDQHTWTRTLPFVTANIRLKDNWSAYFQYANGILVPDLSNFQVARPNLNALAPQTSTNYQVGTVFNGDKFTFDGDFYYISFANKITSSVVAGETVFTNIGGAVYRGVEAQATYAVYEGTAIFANGSINTAKDSTLHTQIAKAPQWTAAFGAFYNHNGWKASLVDKLVGPQWAAAGQPAAYKIGTYNTADLTLAYEFSHYRVEAGIYDLADERRVTQISPNSKGVQFDQYFFQPGRSIQVTAKVNF